MLARNQQLLAKLGHYNTATLHYAGEWYWGVDRLPYLTERLDSLGLRRKDVSNSRLASIRQVMHVHLPVAPPAAAVELPPLEFFHSFRSPYSFLAIRRVFEIADAFGLELKIRPVLPMVMRGLKIPRSKLLYIATDAAREGRRTGTTIGKIADPVGRGAERLLAVYFYAQGQKRERDFLLNASRATWVDGVDVATDRGMRQVSGRTGLFWPDVKAAMEDDSWRKMAGHNRETMLESGSWGVPTLRLGDFVVWGQDRDWMLVRHIEELCDTGDGILI
jgi:2-hydroxychromene-2-carboxylate isomerase